MCAAPRRVRAAVGMTDFSCVRARAVRAGVASAAVAGSQTPAQPPSPPRLIQLVRVLAKRLVAEHLALATTELKQTHQQALAQMKEVVCAHVNGRLRSSSSQLQALLKVDTKAFVTFMAEFFVLHADYSKVPTYDCMEDYVGHIMGQYEVRLQALEQQAGTAAGVLDQSTLFEFGQVLERLDALYSEFRSFRIDHYTQRRQVEELQTANVALRRLAMAEKADQAQAHMATCEMLEFLSKNSAFTPSPDTEQFMRKYTAVLLPPPAATTPLHGQPPSSMRPPTPPLPRPSLRVPSAPSPPPLPATTVPGRLHGTAIALAATVQLGKRVRAQGDVGPSDVGTAGVSGFESSDDEDLPTAAGTTPATPAGSPSPSSPRSQPSSPVGDDDIFAVDDCP